MIHPNQGTRAISAVSASLTFYVILSNQIGVGALGFQAEVYKHAGHDAWISVIMAGIASQLVTWIMIRTLLRFDNKDLYDIQELVYGKWLGKLFNTIYMGYMFTVGFTILRGYIEVVQAWLFPDLSAWVMATLLICLIIYGVTSGIRVIVGYCVLSFFLSIWLFLLYYYAFQYTNPGQILPFFEAKVKSLLVGAYQMAFSTIGFEIIYFIFPFLKEKQLVQKYSQFSLMFTTLTYVSLMITATMFYAGPQLTKVIWATLNMYKIVELPFLERFEFIAVSFWMFIITPNCLLYIWAGSRGMRKIFHIKQKYALYAVSLLMIFFSTILKTHDQVNTFTKYVGDVGIILSFIYPVILYGLVVIKQAWQRRRQKNEQTM